MDGMNLIRAKRGMLSRVAAGLGLTRGAVAMWERVPAERLPDIERITGIPRHELRPDICPPPNGDPSGTRPTGSLFATASPAL